MTTTSKFNIIPGKKGEQIIGERFSDDFLNDEVKQYALYAIKTRATLGLMDGLRVGARKIIFAAIDVKFKSEKDRKGLIKYNSLIGASFDMEYNHGNASLKNTIEQLSSRHVNKLAPFITEGQIPQLRDSTVETADRYLSVGVSKYIDIYNVDLDLLDYNFEEEKWVEPKFFLPIIPPALTYRTSSPGYGIGFNSFSYDIYDVISALQQVLINGTCTGIDSINFKPDIYGIDPEKIIYNENKNSWYNIGDYEIKENSLFITDLPYHINNKKSYIKMLQGYMDKGEIRDFFDRSKEGKITFEIVFAHGMINRLMNAGKFKFFNKFKLIKKIPSPNYNFVDINDKIVSFDNPNDYLDYFVKRRLEFFEIRRLKIIKDLKEKLQYKTDMMNFIEAVITGKLVVFKRPRKDIEVDINKLKLNVEGLKLQTTKYNNESIAELQADIDEIKTEINFYENTTPKEMYFTDLVDLMEEYFRVDIINADGSVTKNLSAYDDNGYEEFDIDSVEEKKPTRKKRKTQKPVLVLN